jgi:hypothetical protein
MTIRRHVSLRMAPFACLAVIGLAAMGCHSMAAAVDDPWAYGSSAATPASLGAYCSTAARDAVVWGTLPSTLCTPYGPPYWSGPAGAYPYFYGRPYGYGRTWRGPGWQQYRGYSGRGYGGGWRGGRR